MFHSIKQGCLLGPMLYVMVVKALGYLLCNKVGMGLIKGILLHNRDSGQLVNGHFTNNSFLIILEEQTSRDHTGMFDYLHI